MTKRPLYIANESNQSENEARDKDTETITAKLVTQENMTRRNEVGHLPEVWF